MRVVAIINQKGGCGKTTTAISLGCLFARSGRRVLVVDMDPQSHVAAGLSIPEARIELDVSDALLSAGDRPPDSTKLIWRAGRNLDVIPSRTRLAGLEAARGGLADQADREHRLSRTLARFAGNYDVAFVDCPPSIGLLTFNALAAAHAVLIPVETSYFSLQGATKQAATIRTLSKRLAEAPACWVVPTIHDESNATSREMLEELRRKFGKRVAPVVIRADARLREAAAYGQGIAEYAPESHGAADYAELATWLSGVVGVGADSRPRVPDRVVARADEEYSPVDVVPQPEAERELARRVGGSSRTEARDCPSAQAAATAVAERPATEVIDRARDLAERARKFAERAARRSASAGPPSEPAPARPARIQPSHLLGVRPTRRGLLFVQPLTIGSSVSIAGDFNAWDPNAGVMRPNPDLGVFELCVPTDKGRHAYRLVADGRWQADAYNPRTETNPYGEPNSIAEMT